MKTLITSSLILIMIAGLVNAQNVEIPDIAFLYTLINRGVDTNGDSLISYAEAEAVYYLNVGNRDINDITGIEAFVNLNALWCHRNNLTSLDVSNNTLLK